MTSVAPRFQDADFLSGNCFAGHAEYLGVFQLNIRDYRDFSKDDVRRIFAPAETNFDNCPIDAGVRENAKGRKSSARQTKSSYNLHYCRLAQPRRHLERQ